MLSSMHLPQRSVIAYSMNSSSARTRFLKLPLPVCCSESVRYAHLPGIPDDELFRAALFGHLEQTFPKNVATFQDSLAEQTIRVLESFLSQFTASPFAEVHQEHQRVLLKIQQAFAGLESMTFSPPPSPIKDKSLGRRRKMSQQELKRAHVKQPAIDERPFQILGIHAPGSLQEYEDIIERVMVTLKRTLSVSIPWVIL